MSDLVWYVYQTNQQLGPFTSEQVTQMFRNKMIALDAYLFKVGWKDWRPLEDSSEELGILGLQPATISRRVAAPRASINGRVIVHNNGQLVIGSGVNISTMGIFVETSDQIFTVGERLKLSVRCEGVGRPFNTIAQVIRYNTDSRYPVGYGLKFDTLEPQIVQEIKKIVDDQNVPRSKGAQIIKSS